MPTVESLALLTVPDVCQILRRSRWSIYGDVRRGHLIAVRIGRDLRFRPADIEAFLAAHTTTGTSSAATSKAKAAPKQSAQAARSAR